MGVADLRIEFDWNGWVPLKVKFVAWCSVQNRLPRSTKLVRRHVFIPDVWCKICLEEDESAAHLFVGCMFAQRVWDYVVGWCKIKPKYILELKDLLHVPKVNHGSPKWKNVASVNCQGIHLGFVEEK
ncbi:putative reverse transcriptase zinc-binding domain-containing protein [Helianthus debilis subsp. tardiflorus]